MIPRIGWRGTEYAGRNGLFYYCRLVPINKKNIADMKPKLHKRNLRAHHHSIRCPHQIRSSSDVTKNKKKTPILFGHLFFFFVLYNNQAISVTDTSA